MCRMIAAPLGLPGRFLIEPFLRMTQGRNALNEHNTEYGSWTHPDGWGAAYGNVDRPQVHRSVLPCWDDPGLEALSDERVFLLHARKASRGGVTLANTHPFEQEVNGKSWFYCHNGMVRDPLPIPPTLAGEDPTDSEKVFHLLLPSVREGEILEGFRTIYRGLCDFTSLNSFLLGPDALWAVNLFTGSPNYYALTLATGPNGPTVSSESLTELGQDGIVLASGTVLRVDRRTGAIETHALDG